MLIFLILVVRGLVHLPNVDEDARILRVIRSRERYKVRRAAAARPARDTYLGTREVELGPALGQAIVYGDLLNAEQVLPVLQTRRDLDREFRFSCAGERDIR